MCLETVKQTYHPPKKVSSENGKFKIGYKVIHIHCKGKTFDGTHYGNGKRFGQWLNSRSNGKKVPANGDDGDMTLYEPGFHIFTSLRAAKKYNWYGGSIFKVQYNDVVADGTHRVGDSIANCVIARRMRVFKKDKVK